MSVSLIDGHIDDDALEMTVESVIENLEKVRYHATSEWDKFIIDDVCAFMKRQKAEIERLTAFKSYFDELYGKGLDVANWHENGDLEPFDNFYDDAVKEMVGEG